MRTNFKLFCTVLFFVGSIFVWAQQKTITGQVTDSDGFPVADAYVYVEGTDNGVYTDADGNYSLSANNGDKVLIEFLGLDTKTITVGNTANYNVKLVDGGSVDVGQVVTLGYTTTTDEAYTGTADVVDAKAIEKKSVSNVSQALAGESAGVRVINTTGQPGSEATIKIRGIGSVNGNTNPLYVVDGVPFDGPLVSINPMDIASTVILKDATATAIYGARGANGVVIINTKKGRQGKTNISYEAKTGFNFNLIPRYDVIDSPETYVELGWQGLRNFALLNGEADPETWANDNLFAGEQGLNAVWNMWDAPGNELIDPSTGKFRNGVNRIYTPGDWEDVAFKPGVRNEHNLSFSSGGDKTTVYSSFGYLNDIGYSINSKYDRLSSRLNVTQEITPWLNSAVNLGYSYSDQDRGGQSVGSGNVFNIIDNMPSIYPIYVRDAEGNIVYNELLGSPEYDYGFDETRPRRFNGNTNAIGDAMFNTRNVRRHDINTNVSFTADITKNLSFQTRFGSQFYSSVYDYINNPYYGRSAESGGYLSKTKSEQIAFNMLEMLTYNNSFGNHNLEVLAAHENNYYKYQTMYGARNFIILPNMPELDNALEYNDLGSYSYEYTLESYFAQANYNFNKKYFLSGTVRRDGSSRFKNNKWGTFGSVGLGWVASKEDFLLDNKHITHLKLKTSYGTTGEQAIAYQGGEFDDTQSFFTGDDLYEISNLEGNLSYIFNTKGNPALTWETSKMFQVGAEMSFWNRVDLNLDYYNKQTDDLLFERRVAPSLGYAIINVNDGKLENSGFEFDLKTDIIKNDNWNVYFNVNGEIPHNELKEMPIDPSTGEAKILDVQGLYGRSEGHSIYDYYTAEWAGVNPETGAAQWVQNYIDTNNDGVYTDGEDTAVLSLTEFIAENPELVGSIVQGTTEKYSDATLKYVGKSALPDVRGAMNLGFDYKRFSMSVQLLYSLGGYSYDASYAVLMANDKIGSNNWHRDMLNAWTQPGDITDVPRLSNEFGQDGNFNRSSTRFLTKSDYLTINNVRIGYVLPDNWVESIGLDSFELFAQGDNLWLFSKREGLNPSTSLTGGSSRYTYSPLSSVTVGLRVKL